MKDTLLEAVLQINRCPKMTYALPFSESAINAWIGSGEACECTSEYGRDRRCSTRL